MNGFARTWAVTLVGLDGSMVEVEADIGQALAAFSTVGLPDPAVVVGLVRVQLDRPASRESRP